MILPFRMPEIDTTRLMKKKKSLVSPIIKKCLRNNYNMSLVLFFVKKENEVVKWQIFLNDRLVIDFQEVCFDLSDYNN